MCQACKAMPKPEHEAKQAIRHGLDQVSNGIKPKQSWNLGYQQVQSTPAEIYFPPYFYAKHGFHRRKRACYPHMELGSILEEYHYFHFVNEKNEKIKIPWCRLDDKKLAIFCTDLQLKWIAESEVLTGDATFSTRPLPSSQVFFMHGLINGEWVTLLTAVMTSKTERDYDRIVDFIKERWNELNLTPKFDRMHFDYKQGLQNAFKKLCGPEKVRGCLFHYAQAIIQKMGELG
uniref:MULE transposase domain-containing protein n=1 Tax=Panagrolaimus sp. JU765 TaxID=591449 RepID=A0AC34R8R0_9BILA